MPCGPGLTTWIGMAPRFPFRRWLALAGLVLALAVGVMASSEHAAIHEPSPARSAALPPAFHRVFAAITPGTLRLEGQVIDVERQPVAGATVTLAGNRVSHTEADGSFAFEQLAPGDYALAAEYADAYTEQDTALDDTSEPVMLTLRRGPSLVVHVLDAIDRKPIAGATISTLDRTAVTDARGDARLRCLDFGAERIAITALGYASQRISVASLDPAETMERTIILDLGAAVSGLVLDRDGKPIAEADVELRVAGDLWSERATTDAAGRWAMPLVGPGKHAINASSSLHLESSLVFDHDGVTERSDLVLKLETGARITGIVVDERGVPVEGAQIGSGAGSAIADASGRFAITAVPEGKHEVFAVGKRGASSSTHVTLAAGGHAEIRLVLITSSIAGIVVDQRGEPVEDVLVFAMRPDHQSYLAYSDEQGRFDLEGVRPGSYDVTAERRSDDTRELEVKLHVKHGDRSVRIVMPDLGTVSGRVMLAGQPVPYFGFLLAPEPDASHGDPVAVRSRDGRFRQRHVGPGTWSVVIVGPGFERRAINGIRVAPGQHLELGDILVSRGRTVTGQVTDSRGAVIGGASVRMYRHRLDDEGGLAGLGSESWIVRTDAGGHYRIEGVPVDVSGMMIDARHDRRGIALERPLGDTDRHDLVLIATGSIDGTIANLRRGIRSVTARNLAEGTSWDARVDAGGSFHLEHLPPGDYQIRVDNTPVPPVGATVVAGRRSALAIDLPAVAITVAIQVRGGCSYLSLTSHASRFSEQLAFESCRNDEPVEIDGLAPGAYELCIETTRCSQLVVSPSPHRQLITVESAP
ncbi:MAG: carboxypeptidase-like regulatory domain-containing protein [Kofleriaceae bacterium]